jgi:hypothetical protein
MSSSARPCITLSFLNGGFRPAAQLSREYRQGSNRAGWEHSDLAVDLVHIPSRRDSIGDGQARESVAQGPDIGEAAYIESEARFTLHAGTCLSYSEPFHSKARLPY